MQTSDLPRRFPIPFGNGAGSAFIRTIPTNHVAPTTGDAPASLQDGFPPENFAPLSSGGIPPNGADFNGILFQLSGWARWMAAGGPIRYDSTFATAIGGYPAGAVLQSATVPGRSYYSTANNNMGNPDTGAPDWVILIGASATAAQIRAGVEENAVVTPKALRDASYGGSNAFGSWEYTPSGFLRQWGTFTYSAPGTPNLSSNFTFPTPFGVGQVINATPSQLPSGSYAAMTCIASFVSETTGRLTISSGNAAQNITLAGTISWEAIGTPA